MTDGVTAVWPFGWLVALLVPATVLVVIVAALVERSSPIRLRHWAEDASPRLRAFYEAPPRFEAFRFLLSLIARLLPVALFAVLVALFQLTRGADGGWWAAGTTVLVLAVTEWLNRGLVELRAEAALKRLTPVLRAASVVLSPLVWLLARWVAHGDLEDWEEDEDIADNELSAYIDVGRREGILEPEEEALVRSIVDFGDTQVKSVMTPRVEIASAAVELPLADLATVFFESKHARLPLYRESVDQVVGILHIRDLFEALQTDDSQPAEALIKPPHFVPEAKPVRDLLTELQALHQQMAIVVDEYGGVAGLVTVEDLVEEIVGEIADEHEAEPPGFEQLADGGWRLEGRTELAELPELVGVDLDDEVPYETVSGLICGELGYVPKPGETFLSHHLTFRIEEADERRVTTVVVQPAASEPPAEPAA